MKYSWLLTALILLAAVARWQFTRSTTANLQKQITVEKSLAAAAGLDPEAAALGQAVGTPRGAAAATAAELQSHETHVRNFAEELIAFAIEMKAGEMEPSAEMKQRLLSIMDRFLELSGDDLKILIAQVSQSPAMDAGGKAEMIGFSLMMLGQSNPEGAVRLFRESRDLLGDNQEMGKQMAATSLSAWAAKDPFAAMDWMEDPANKDMVDADAWRNTLAAVAARDPVMALQKLMAVSTEENQQPTSTAHNIGAAASAENRSALLTAASDLKPDPSLTGEDLKAASKRIRDINTSVRSGIARGLTEGDFEQSAAWIAQADLSRDDRTELIKNVSRSLHGEDPTPWLGWISENVRDAVETRQLTQNIIPDWTRNDFNAVGEWINTQPEGELRNSATRSFAETLASQEPEAAGKWALTLPDTSDRTDLLRDIQRKWSSKDPDAAAAFSAEHGLER